MQDEADLIVDIEAWVDLAHASPQDHRLRQTTEVILNAIAITPLLRKDTYLKGGTLMGLAYGSPRRTADIDFTSSADFVEGIDAQIRQVLDPAMEQAAIHLGYATLVCRVQTIKRQPNPTKYPLPDFPALKMTIAFAERDTPAHEALKVGKCSQVIEVDVSYNECVRTVQSIRLNSSGATILAYSLTDMLAEKMRAYLQQERRRRIRRQDIYDLAWLIKNASLNAEEAKEVLEALIDKCRARGFEPDPMSIYDPALQRRAKLAWPTLADELEVVPSFEECFAEVEAFYRSMPWGAKMEDKR